MRLSQKAMSPIDGKVVFLDTSGILSNQGYLCGKDAYYVVTTGVMHELQSIALDSEGGALSEIAMDEYERLNKLLEEGDKGVFLFHSKFSAYDRISELSDVDQNIIDCAERFQHSIIFSNDWALCFEAEKRGIPTCKVRTRSTNNVA